MTTSDKGKDTNLKIKKWDKRKEKKARFKKSIARAKKRGDLIYGGFILINFDKGAYAEDDNDRHENANRLQFMLDS